VANFIDIHALLKLLKSRLNAKVTMSNDLFHYTTV
jgi:hypothetical protein